MLFSFPKLVLLSLLLLKSSSYHDYYDYCSRCYAAVTAAIIGVRVLESFPRILRIIHLIISIEYLLVIPQ